MQLRSISFAAVLLSIFFIVKFLEMSQSILIPFIFAILFCNLLSTIANFFQATPVIGKFIPRVLAITIGFLLLILVFSSIGKVLTENTQKIILSTQNLQSKINILLQHFANKGFSKSYVSDFLQNMFKQINFQHLILGFYSTISNVMSSVFLMILFVIFIFIEQNDFPKKLMKIFPQKNQYDKVLSLLKSIPHQIQFYLTMKTLFSAITGFAIYIILKLMNLEFAAFWGTLVFLFNFIPNIGAIAVTIMITLLGYFQWYDLTKVGILLLSQLVIHVFIGNFIETHYLGKTMHLSPLFLIISLCFWGMLWGGTGLFLAVPMTVLLMIVFGSFESTRMFAIMLSEKGDLPKDCYGKLE